MAQDTAREFPRERYLGRLIGKQGNGLVKVITGVRRCGKSYLMNTLFYRHLISSGVPERNIVRFAFDSANDLALIGEDLIELTRSKRLVSPEKFISFVRERTATGGGTCYLLLDEVQMLEGFEAVLNGYLRQSELDIYVTGSNARLLSKDVATEFAGRGDEVRLHPLTFAEFMGAWPGDRYEGFAEYLLYGGIPPVVLAGDAREKEAALFRLFSEIYIRDIVTRNKIRNQAELEDLLNVLASSVGSLTNPEKLKNTFRSKKRSKITGSTVKRYLGCLEDAFLVEAAQRFDVRGRAYIGTPQKYYFEDVGLRNARLGFRQFEQTHLMENAIYNELRARGYSVDVGVVPVSERGKNGKPVRKQLEIDFVANLGSRRCYVQSAWSLPNAEKRAQETRPFAKVPDSFKKIVVTNDVVPATYDNAGVLTMNVYDFLLNENSIEG